MEPRRLPESARAARQRGWSLGCRAVPIRTTELDMTANAPAGNESPDEDEARDGQGAVRSSAPGQPSADAAAHGAAGGGHRVEVATNRHRVRVIHLGVTVADTQAALTLSETGLPDVFYFPRADVNMARLERSAHTSRCPFKGEASYYHLLTEEGVVENAVWTYETPLDSVKQIKGYLAFYVSRVDRIDQTS
jgi:uncharacterized protein (DUF427 family)